MKAKFSALQEILTGMDSVLVAYSGGVDSSLLLKVAHDLLGERAAGLLVVSPTLPQYEQESAQVLADEMGWKLYEMVSSEMALPDFIANTEQRCYICKDHRYRMLTRFAGENGFEQVLDGANVDDLGDFRPGQRAAAEHGIRSPLQEAGLSKQDIRTLAKELDLPNWDKPSSACLASRIPYGTPITVEILSRIGRAEGTLADLGFSQLRVRHHQQIARIEVPVAEFERVITERGTIIKALLEEGYDYICLDLEGFQSGSMNKGIRPNG